MKTKINIKHIIGSLMVTACFMTGHEVFAQATMTLTSGTNYSPAALYLGTPSSSAVAYIQHDRNPGNPDTGGLQLLARNTRPIQFFTQEINVPFTSDSEVMRISANGSLGIGTKTPSAKLDVIGSGHFSTNVGIGTTTPSANLHVNGTSQFDGTGYFSGDVGIGITNPSAALHVNGASQFDGTGYFSGDVGIGTATPRGILDVDGSGDIYLVDDPNNNGAQTLYIPGHIYIAPFGGSDVTYIQARRKNNLGSTQMRFRTYDNGQLTEAMQISAQGNIGIGTVSPSEKLDVSGNIKADGVILNIGTFPDYVFEEGYPLMPLDKVERYIKTNKHLPGFPSEVEVIKTGANLGQINNLLVEKVEELTLYTIAQEKQIDTLSKALDVLQAKFDELLKKQ